MTGGQDALRKLNLAPRRVALGEVDEALLVAAVGASGLAGKAESPHGEQTSSLLEAA